MDFVYKTAPREHQAAEFLKTRDREAYAHFWEMGTGKSKLICDVAAWNYNIGKIEALVVIAPNGVHRNWVTDEIPKHLPDYTTPLYAYWAATPKAAERKAWENLYTPGHHGLRCFIFNVEGFKPKSRSAMELEKILRLFKCLMVIDESQGIKSPSAKRTKVLARLGEQAVLRRIMTGTWTDGTPLDAYAQFKFLSPNILGFQTYTAYRNHFAIVEQRRVDNKRGFYDHVVGFRNQEQLGRLMAPYTSILYKRECLDLPDKVFEKVPVEMTPEQQRIYKQLLQDGVTQLMAEHPDMAGAFSEDPEEALLSLFDPEKDAGRLSVSHALTLLLRLQQVLGGWVPDDAGKLTKIPSKRLTALTEILEGITGKVIIWARFTAEVDDICELLGDKAVRYDGQVKDSERQANMARFKTDPSCRYFVGKTKVGGTGLTLTEASFMIYYSQEFSRIARLQSEDRAHRIGQSNKVTYIDLHCPGTVDDKIMRDLAKKNRTTNDIDDKVRRYA